MTHVKSTHNGFVPPRNPSYVTQSREPRNLVQRRISKTERGDKGCFYCGKCGHYERDSFKKYKDVKDNKIKYMREYKHVKPVSFIAKVDLNDKDMES